MNRLKNSGSMVFGLNYGCGLWTKIKSSVDCKPLYGLRRRYPVRDNVAFMSFGVWFYGLVVEEDFRSLLTYDFNVDAVNGVLNTNTLEVVVVNGSVLNCNSLNCIGV